MSVEMLDPIEASIRTWKIIKSNEQKKVYSLTSTRIEEKEIKSRHNGEIEIMQIMICDLYIFEDMNKRNSFAECMNISIGPGINNNELLKNLS